MTGLVLGAALALGLSAGCSDDTTTSDAGTTLGKDASTTGTGDSGTGTMAQRIEMSAMEFSFSPNAINVTAGQPFTIVLTNTGTMPHSIEFDLPSGTAALPNLLQPGGSAELQVTPPSTAGDFQFICPVPGHKEAGMVGTMHVSASAG